MSMTNSIVGTLMVSNSITANSSNLISSDSIVTVNSDTIVFDPIFDNVSIDNKLYVETLIF